MQQSACWSDIIVSWKGGKFTLILLSEHLFNSTWSYLFLSRQNSYPVDSVDRRTLELQIKSKIKKK